VRRAGLAAVALLPLAGCGGSSPAQYAGMSEYEARTEVMHGITRLLEDRTSTVYGHRVRLIRVDPGHTPNGEDAWVGRFADRTVGGEIYVRVTGHPHAFGSDVDVEIDRCMGAGM
jgi:hypothetical protein